MDEELVADSEGEEGLELSPQRYSLPKPLDAPFEHLQPQSVQPGSAAYSPSTISEFPSTLQTIAKRPFDSPIVNFTATTHSSVVKNTPPSKKTKTTTETIELTSSSSEEEVNIPPKPRKPPRQKAASPSESAYSEPAKPGNEHCFTQEPKQTLEYAGKSRKQSDAYDGEIPSAKDKAKKAKQLAKANTANDSLSVNEHEEAKPVRKAPKKRKSTVKKNVEDNEELIPEAPKASSRKRKSPDNDIAPVAKPSKKRKKESPPIEDVGDKVEDYSARRTPKGRRLVHVSDEESADELLLTTDTPVEAKKFKSSATTPMRKSESIAPEDKAPIVSSNAPSPQVQRSKPGGPLPPSSESPALMPAKVVSRLSTEGRQTYAIPKRGSISDLLRKTGLHAPLSSSKLTRKAGDRIAPLHTTRTTPPPPPPPIPKPKKKVVDKDEDEDDFTGMTEKQIAKFLEEKKKKAWYSP